MMIPSGTIQKEILFATTNSGKAREVAALFAALPVTLRTLRDMADAPDIEETGSTFEENALLKAEGYAAYYGMPVIAEDSGIVCVQLNGAPGVFSARYSGENATDELNNEKLLAELKAFPEPHPAAYQCCAVYTDGNRKIISYGTIAGRIIFDARGDGGFGYDPYFVPEGYEQTMAQLDPQEKNSISHRARAFNALINELQKIGIL